MDFSTINWLAVVVAAVAAWLFGAVWYGALMSKPWIKATKLDPATMSKSKLPFIISFVCEVIMALVASLLLSALTGGEPSVLAGLVFGFVFWLGFVFTTMATNHRYEGFGWDLTLIDGGHWLGVLLIIGAMLGWFGGPAAPV